MEYRPERSGYEQLIGIIRQVRGRWRMRVALRGAAMVAALGFLAFAVSAYGMDYFRYSEGSVTLFRVFAYLAMAGLAVRFLLLLPRLRRVSDEQVALYVEEHHPELQQAVLSAVEAGAQVQDQERPQVSPALIQKLVATAAEQCETMGYGRGIEHKRLQRASGTLAVLATVGMLAVILGPAFLRHGGSLLIKPWGSARAANPYFITVEPGDIVVARGADQVVGARLGGFDSDRVEIAVQTDANTNAAWQRWPMTFDDEAGTYGFMLFDLQKQTHYYVEASGVRSDMFRIDVADLPFVDRIDLEYVFPDYTGLEPRRVEDGGDIAALPGTRVELTITPTIKVAGGHIQLEGVDPLPLEIHEDTTLTGHIDVERDGFYKIELEAFDGRMHSGSPDYTIEVLTDQPPTVSISKPGRDSKVTSIEEVFTEVEANDDYGVGKLELVYSVNGGGEQRVALYRNNRAPKKELSAGHTFFLEDFELQPGDFISYFAQATDANGIGGTQTATTDIYFIEVRPFGKEYRQAQQMGGGGGAGADGALSLRQRQIVAATFKLIRDKKDYSAKEYGENLTTIALMQGRLREQVENLLRRMTNRGISQQAKDFGRISESLRLAAVEMVPAEELLMQRKPTEALPPEQRALQHLQRAESTFRDVQVAFGGGGTGGGEQSNAEELADLFELELDKLRNQYETVERGERESADNQIDEALQRLQELARRQQQENERMKRRAANFPNQGGGGGAAQRDLAEETEELARKLERLAREQSMPDLMDTARRLREAADAMRRGATKGKEGSLAEGIAALDELKNARRLLEKDRSVRLEQELRDAIRRAERLASQQDKVISEVQKLGSSGGASRTEHIERLIERKDEMAAEVEDLESSMDRMARDSRSEQKEASRKLQEAANSIRDSKLKEKIRYSKGVVQGRSSEYAEQFEEQVRADIADLLEKIRQAEGSIGSSEESQVAQSIDKTRDLVRNIESLGDRVRERRDRSRRLGAQPGREGESSPSGAEEEAQGGGEAGQGEEDSEQGREGQQGQTGGREQSFGPGVSGAGSQDGRYQPGIFSTEEIRQWRREFRERAKEAEELSRDLQRQQLQVPDLKSIIERIKQFDSKQIYLDPLGFDELQTALLEELKQFEYWLHRELEGMGKEKLFLAGSDEVPSDYRKLVEEYYRSLSRDTNKKP